MSFSSYEQEFVVNNQLLYGITSLSASYGASVSPLNLAGIGYIDSFISGPVEAEFSIARYMIGPDALDSITDNQKITGGFVLGEGTKQIGFRGGRLVSRRVSCNVGEIPTIDNTIRVYGNFGDNIPSIVGGVNYNAISVPVESRTYTVPTQGSISISIGGSTDYSILAFNYNRELNLEALYALNKERMDSLENYEALDTQIIYPIQTRFDFTLSQENYSILNMRSLMDYDKIDSSSKDIVITIKDPEDSSVIINQYTAKNAKLSSVSQTSAVEQDVAVNLSYVGYETDSRTPDSSGTTSEGDAYRLKTDHTDTITNTQHAALDAAGQALYEAITFTDDTTSTEAIHGGIIVGGAYDG